MGISAVIITFNEADKIGDCIRSVSWADEIVVVDSHSTDRTREIATKLGARVVERDWQGFSAQKQFATDTATNKWVFSIDADEVVTPELAKEITSLDLNSADAFRLPRLSYYLGKPIRHGSWYPDMQTRLYDRTRCSWTNDVIHESVTVPSGRLVDLRSDLLHYSSDGILHHAQMIVQRYAPLGAAKLKEQGRTVGITSMLLAGPAAFISGYFFKFGILDGVRGLLIAIFAGINAFLKYAIRYEQQLTDQQTVTLASATDGDDDTS